MRVAIGADHRGVALKAKVKDMLERAGHSVEDQGAHSNESVDYPDFAAAVASRVSNGQFERGILICGTGTGMCIAANKFANVRAVNCQDELTAQMSRRHNDANVLCLPADLLGEKPIEGLITSWLDTAFEGGRHARRVDKLSQLDRC
jgi:ribose 5-phosphate isomerase B